MEKAARYRKCGTKEVWVFDPDTRQAFVQGEDRQAILGEADTFESDSRILDPSRGSVRSG
jgi:Uma2 family endonuclease